MMQRESERALTISALASAAGVGVETVRYYQRRGLLASPRPAAGAATRRYGSEDLARLRFIRRAQRLGFSLDEVATLLALDAGRECPEARRLAEHKLDSVEARLRDLRALQRELRQLIGRCRSVSGTVRCPLIAALDDDLS